MKEIDISIAISVVSLLVSIAVLHIHLKNRRTNLHTYWINRNVQRYSAPEINVVRTVQERDFYIIHIIYFNPGSIASILQSLTIYKQVDYKFPLIPIVFNDWDEVTESKWWPTESPNDFKRKYMADEYANLYVENYKDILVMFPGNIDRALHRFYIKTNQGGYRMDIVPGIGDSSFAYSSSRAYRK